MRHATIEDALELAELENVIFPENCFNEVTLAKEIEAGICWVHQPGSCILGYLLARKDGNLLDVLRLGVHPEHQNTGIGTALLEESIREAESSMLTVKKVNLVAMRLYHRYGFRIVGELQEGGWVMKR